MPSRCLLLRTAAGGLAACLLLNIAMAQTPTATVNDYLKEIRIFASGSPDFAKIASSLGVDAALPTIPGASLVVAIRNDSGQAVESMRILFQLVKDGQATPRDIELWHGLAAGSAMLTAPREVRGPLVRLVSAGKLGLVGFGGPPEGLPLDDYQGAGATVSIDSITLADGKFIGADTLSFFPLMVAEEAAKKSFFSDLASQSRALSVSEIRQALTARQSAAEAAENKSIGLANFPFAAMTELRLCTQALMVLEHSGLEDLSSWAQQEKLKLSSQPTLHK